MERVKAFVTSRHFDVRRTHESVTRLQDVLENVLKSIKSKLPWHFSIIDNVWVATRQLFSHIIKRDEEFRQLRDEYKRTIDTSSTKLAAERTVTLQREKRCYRHIVQLEAILERQQEELDSLRRAVQKKALEDAAQEKREIVSGLMETSANG